MSLDCQIDQKQRLVRVRAHGILTVDDLWGYQRQMWSGTDLAGYDELVDMSDVEKIDSPSGDRVKALAELAAKSDATGPPSRLAIIAPSPLAFGLARMYEAYRGGVAGSTKQVGVFRTRDKALEFLRRGERAGEPV